MSSGVFAAMVDAQEQGDASGSAKNVILMIGDGMGYNQVDAASMYENGTSYHQLNAEPVASQVYQQFPVQVAMATFSVDGNGTGQELTEENVSEGYDPQAAREDFTYVSRKNEEPYDRYTDSAAAGTAMASGVRTKNDVVGQSVDGEDLPTVLEGAAENGKSTGLAVSVQICHATPAVFAAHNEDRGNYEEISQEMIQESPLDVLMGAGHPDFDNNNCPYPETYAKDHQYVGGEDLWEDIKEGVAGAGDTPWTLVESREEFQVLAEGETPERVLGVVQAYETLQHERDGDALAASYEVPLNSGVPTLQEMTRASLNILGKNEEGMFLMIEGGAIDWACHANRLGRLIEEQSDFNRSVEAVVEWVETNSSWEETLVIVTADHECGYLLGPGSGPEAEPMRQPLANNGAGVMPGAEWFSPFHTNDLVPLYAKGAGASLFEEAATEEDPQHGLYMDITATGEGLFDVQGIEEPAISGE